MLNYPLTFEASASASKGWNTIWECKAGALPHILCAIPKEFNGPGGGYSPEDLIALAVLNCFIATFKVFAEKSNVEFKKIEGQSSMIIDRAKDKAPEITKIHMTFTLHGFIDREKILTLLEDAKKHCIIGNAVNAEKTYTFNL
ncbi:MAG TPA: OsmC family protein [Rhabdochlamydiaceae bacterium]|nr:OsmC family protein [Rhabdochlamydiaceae bacterium]